MFFAIFIYFGLRPTRFQSMPHKKDNYYLLFYVTIIACLKVHLGACFYFFTLISITLQGERFPGLQNHGKIPNYSNPCSHKYFLHPILIFFYPLFLWRVLFLFWVLGFLLQILQMEHTNS